MSQQCIFNYIIDLIGLFNETASKLSPLFVRGENSAHAGKDSKHFTLPSEMEWPLMAIRNDIQNENGIS